MAETLILDPSAIAVNRTEWDITQYVAEAGPDWGDAAFEQYMADADRGSLPVDFRIPNRVITIPLLLLKSRQGTAYTFEQVRRRLQQKAGLFQQEGGWIGRNTSIGTVFADVVGATLKLGGSSAQALWGIDADAVLTLTCLPDWYGGEVVGSSQFNAAGSGELVYTIAGIAGELPARARLAISGQFTNIDLHGLLWGVRNRNYSAATTARLAYEAEALTPIAPAASAANASASGGNEVVIAAVGSDWTAVLSTDLASTGSLTHTGSYRVWARVRTTAAAKAPKVRLVWDVGDLLLPVENAPVRMPLSTDFWLTDLGSIRLDPAPIGFHRWQGVIQAADGDGAFAVDKVWLQPLDEAAGKLSASPVATLGLTGYSARDGFDQTAGALTGKALPLGGVWTFASGDTDDYTVDATNHQVVRNAASDTGRRTIYASTPTLTATAAQIDFFLSPGTGGGNQTAYLVFRLVDGNNFGYVQVERFAAKIAKAIGGSTTVIKSASLPWDVTNAWWTMRVMATAQSDVYVWLFPQGSVPPPNPIVSRADNSFAAGQTLASGKVGFADNNTGTNADPRYYDNFAAWVPDSDAVMFFSKNAELRYDGMFREASGGSFYAPVSTVVGDLLRLPPAGLDGRPTEIFLKPSVGDLDQGGDSVMPRIDVQMRHRPCYLFVP